jgi:hypothetical protein
MIRLTDEQWERIRMHFPEEHIPDGRDSRSSIQIDISARTLAHFWVAARDKDLPPA